MLRQSEGRFTKANVCRNGASLGPAYLDYPGSPQSLSVSPLGQTPPQLMS